MAQRRVHPMRFVLAGLLAFHCINAILAQEVAGDIESIGFNGAYRPECFTPMIVRIRAGALESGDYLLQVRQKDLDGDDVVFTRTISITGGESSPVQRFSMYFLPQPSGLPDPNDGGTVRDLQRELKVFLCTRNGKQLASLPVRDTIRSIDPPRGAFGSQRGTKLILAVSGNGSAPSWSEYGQQESLLGVLEDVVFVQISPRDLPENPVAYQAIDAILWMNVDPSELKLGGDEKFRALQHYVRQGGHLVLCQSRQWQTYLEFGDLLPVTILGMDQKEELQPLRELARSDGKPRTLRDPKAPPGTPPLVVEDPWLIPKGPFLIARAEANPNTVVDEWVQWDGAGADRTPYIVRKSYGLGGVTWVAQDLGDPMLTSRTKTGWMHVWEAVFDWKNWPQAPVLVTKYTTDEEKWPFSRGGNVDMGAGLNPGILNHRGTVSALIAIAVAFFIIYWVISGPGLFAYLATRRRQNLSWFGFALSAMIAALITVLIVKLVVRGPPALKHNTVILHASGQPPIVDTTFGLYVKQDGSQQIQIAPHAPGTVATITPQPLHPEYHRSGEQSSPIEYTVPVRGVATDEPASITFPYRNTSKKFRTIWTQGPVKDNERLLGIEGSAKLQESGISGSLTNATGNRLENLYFAYKQGGDVNNDWMLWLKNWEPGVTYDLDRLFNRNEKGESPAFLNRENQTVPGGKEDRIRATLDIWQAELWNSMLSGRVGITGGDGQIEDLRQSFALLSFFGRLKPIRNVDRNNLNRVEVLRRGARHLDRSPALAAGALVILAEVPDAPLPLSLTVEGDPVTGSGPVFYQFVVPIDRSALAPDPTTQPAAAD